MIVASYLVYPCRSSLVYPCRSSVQWRRIHETIYATNTAPARRKASAVHHRLASGVRPAADSVNQVTNATKVEINTTRAYGHGFFRHSPHSFIRCSPSNGHTLTLRHYLMVVPVHIDRRQLIARFTDQVRLQTRRTPENGHLTANDG